MGLSRVKRILLGCGCVLLAALFGLCLLLPLSGVKDGSGAEIYTCIWKNGTVTEETFLSAYENCVGVSQNGGILLVRETESGEIAPSAEFTRAYGVLTAGSLGEMLACDFPLPRLERFALYQAFSSTLWYDGEAFAFTGDRVVHTDFREAHSLVLLRGGIAKNLLQEGNVKVLYLRAEAEITGDTLVGTQVEKVVASAPFALRGGAITQDAVGGKSLVAGLPLAKSIAVEDVLFASEGALLACSRVEELDLPFLGNTAQRYSGYDGRLAFLFFTGWEYRVPNTLKRVKVRGGVVEANAFYGCSGVQNIDLCGVNAENIAPNAFQTLSDLRLLHTPRADVLLSGNFTKAIAPCGCTVFERTP